jgi:hypothetical protein
MIRRGPVLLAIAMLAAAASARGDDIEQAKAHFRHAVELYKQQRWRDAAGEFEAAYHLKPHGAIRYNVAQCRERLEEWPAAYRAYNDYLREVPDAKDRAAVRTSLRKIEERLARQGRQVLLVYSDPPGARVSLDGVERGMAPLDLVLPKGEYALAIALEGYEPVAEKVALGAKASKVLDLVLKPEAKPAAKVPAAAESAGAVGAPGPAGSASRAASAPDLGPRPPEVTSTMPAGPPPSSSRMLPTWIAAGTAVAAVAAGVIFGASAQADARAIGSASSGAQANQLARSAQSKARTANVL